MTLTGERTPGWSFRATLIPTMAYRAISPVAPARLTCPACHNSDLTETAFFAETIETDRSLYPETVDGILVFAFAKGVHTDPGLDPPSVQCLRCYEWSSPPANTFELR